MEQVEDELRVRDGVTDVTKGVGELLHALTVGRDGHVALKECVELGADVDGARFFVVVKSTFDGNPKIACMLVRLHGDV